MRLPKTHKIGSVIPHGVKPAPHEWETILFFTELGKDVECIAWEAKSPTNNHHRTIERSFYTASNQSSNIIIDLRRARGRENSLNTFEKCFKHTRKVRNMYIITKNKELKAYKK